MISRAGPMPHQGLTLWQCRSRGETLIGAAQFPTRTIENVFRKGADGSRELLSPAEVLLGE
jgi:hypothetical protein